MRISIARGAFALLAIAGLASCSDSVAPRTSPSAPTSAAHESSRTQLPRPALLISQVYGGGGNSGAKYKNDFIELYNPGTAAVTVDGWSVQYASASGSSWNVTRLAGSIQPGHYYLVQESAGAGGTDALPTADATGTIAMGATGGKVLLSKGITALTGTCPAAAVDEVSFGAATDCGTGHTDATSNTKSAIRNSGGCDYTGSLADDFTIDLAAPRNSASAVHVCPGTFPLGPLDHVTLAGASTVMSGSTVQLNASAEDEHNQALSDVQLTWGSSDASIATVDASGTVTGGTPSANPVTITVTATSGDISKTATLQLTVTLPVIGWVDLTSSSASFPPGFQTQVFGTARTAQNGTIIPAIFTFQAVNPEIATVANVSNTGIVTAVAPPADGTTKPGITVTATPLAGGASYSFTAHPITVVPGNYADVSTYAKNDEFGDPTTASASDANDRLIVRNQYTLSYNASRGTPNWVSYEIDARQFGAEDRCNCFTADPQLPAEERIYTSDYTNGGYDRGHMARSADRTVANGDNATTFYLTNIVPQKADLNQGVWAQFENALGDSAKAGRAVYVITGPLYSRGKSLQFLKNEGKVAIPDSTWKVAIIGPDKSAPFTAGDLKSWDDLAGTTVLAVNMPNDSGVRNDPWAKYLTTVRKIESSTGYDFLSLLPRAFQDAVERGDHAPVARASSAGDMNEGSSITFDASASSDQDLGRTDMELPDALSYAWQFSDGASATGAVVSHAFANDGIYTATLTVTDAYGWAQSVTITDTVANVAPVLASLSGATILRGESYVTTGSFADPGSDIWTATADYGDGAGAQSLALADHAFSLSHTYAGAGNYTVTVTVNDGEATNVAHATVVVESSAQGIAHLRESVAALGGINAGERNSLDAKLRNAAAQLGRGDAIAAGNTLDAFGNEVQAMTQSGRLDATAAESMIAYARRVIASL